MGAIIPSVMRNPFSPRKRVSGKLVRMDKKPKRWEIAGGIGDLSVRLGYDIRDVWMAGYSDEQINGVLAGEYTLSELWKMKPLGNDRTPFGKEILSGKRKS